MITDAIITFVVTVWSFLVGLLPSEAHLPQVIFDSVALVQPYVHTWDQIFPMDTLFTALLFVWGVRIVVLVMRSVLISMAFARGSAMIKSFF